MITLKIAPYSKNEVKTLIELLTNCQHQLAPVCRTAPLCFQCEIKHLCVDITSVLSYAESYLEKLDKDGDANV